jgi:putative ABC transport system permease protein
MKYLRLAFRSLGRNRRRTILTIISIGVSIFIFCGVLILPVFFAMVIKSSAASLRLVCHAKAGLSYSMPEAYGPKIAAMPHVDGVDSWSAFMGLYHDPSDQFTNLGIDPDSIPTVWSDWHLSKETRDAFESERIAALVGLDTMKSFNFQIGQQIMLKGTIFPVNLTVKIVGTLPKGTMPSVLLMRRDYLEESTGHRGRVDVYWLKVDRREHIQQVIEELDEAFANSSSPTQTETEQSFQSNVLQQFETVIYLMELFAVIILVSITLVAANTAAMSIRERRSEVAVMRSLGFTTRTVSLLLIAESMLLGAIAGIVGTVLAELSVKIEGPRILGGVGLAWLPPSIVGYALFVAIAIGAISAIVPAIGIVRRSIVDELRAVA